MSDGLASLPVPDYNRATNLIRSHYMRTFILLTVWCLASSTASAQTPPGGSKPTLRLAEKNESLKNIRIITVTVSNHTKLESQVTSSTLRNALELRLRQAGISVKNSDEAENSLYPSLDVWITAIVDDNGLVSYNISSEFNRLLLLPTVADEKIYVNAMTWKHAKIVTVGRTRVSESLREDIDDAATAFLNVYLEQNPKQ